jgi:hypothetical protein
MEDSAYIGGMIAGLAYFIAGARLYRLSSQTGELPERLLGAAFLTWGVSYLSWQLPIAMETGSLANPLLVVGRVTNDIGVVAFAFFVTVVFRNQERWATWLAIAVGVCVVGGLGGSIWVGDEEGIRPLGNPSWWLQTAGEIALFVWTAAEGFIQHRKARQRLRLGLCEPMICNRYLLWGLTGAVWVVYEFVVIVQQIEFERTQVWSASMDSVVGGIELIAVALIWFVFFPPAFYQRRIDRTDSAATVGEG